MITVLQLLDNLAFEGSGDGMLSALEPIKQQLNNFWDNLDKNQKKKFDLFNSYSCDCNNFGFGFVGQKGLCSFIFWIE